MLLLPEKQRGEAREPSREQCSFGYREELVGKYISHFFCFLMSVQRWTASHCNQQV